MANIQKHFEKFDDEIRLKKFEDNKVLRDKRDIIRNKLEERLPSVFDDHKNSCPKFWFRNQGSYEMGTGIKPLTGDFDIDQGIYFEASTADLPEPVILKSYVHEALDGHTKRVEIRRSCVTVFYQFNDEPIYHVDVAVYSHGDSNDDNKSKLAKGKANSSEENKFWEVSHPQKLSKSIFERLNDSADRDQFRRIVRYLKRWRDYKFPSDGNAKPSGIALTVAASYYLNPNFSDHFSKTPDDLTAIRDLVITMVNGFSLKINPETGDVVERLEVLLPIEPNSDLFESMTDIQMKSFKERLVSLLESLEFAIKVSDEVEACEELRRKFGDDFPVPEKKDASRIHSKAIISSSSSA